MKNYTVNDGLKDVPFEILLIASQAESAMEGSVNVQYVLSPLVYVTTDRESKLARQFSSVSLSTFRASVIQGFPSTLLLSVFVL